MGFAETAVIEFRYWTLSPQTYSLRVEKYGHTAFGPAKDAASAFPAGSLGNLANECLVQRTIVPTTGYWSFNTTTGAYGRPGSAVEPLGWVRFAVENLGVDPEKAGRRSVTGRQNSRGTILLKRSEVMAPRSSDNLTG